jgi:hypothetical protein
MIAAIKAEKAMKAISDDAKYLISLVNVAWQNRVLS